MKNTADRQQLFAASGLKSWLVDYYLNHRKELFVFMILFVTAAAIVACVGLSFWIFFHHLFGDTFILSHQEGWIYNMRE